MIGSLIDTNRNIAIHGNYLFDSTSDDWVIAIDARTGEVAWKRRCSTTQSTRPTRPQAPSSPTGR